jgi:hypothetical protein
VENHRGPTPNKKSHSIKDNSKSIKYYQDGDIVMRYNRKGNILLLELLKVFGLNFHLMQLTNYFLLLPLNLLDSRF